MRRTNTVSQSVFDIRTLNKVPYLSYGVVSVMLRIAFWYNTDLRQTDEQTDKRQHVGIPC